MYHVPINGDQKKKKVALTGIAHPPISVCVSSLYNGCSFFTGDVNSKFLESCANFLGGDVAVAISVDLIEYLLIKVWY